MGNTIGTPGQTPESLENLFSNYLKVATEGTGDSYDQDDLNKIKATAKTLSEVIEKISSGDTLPSDRAHKLRQFEQAAPNIIKDLKISIDKKYEALIEPEQEALFRVSLDLTNAQEIRSTFAELAGDTTALTTIVSQLTDETFEALRVAPQRPIIKKKNGGVDSVELVSFIPRDLEESELRRRRPATALRLDIFEARRQSFPAFANTLGSLVTDRLASLSRGF